MEELESNNTAFKPAMEQNVENDFTQGDNNIIPGPRQRPPQPGNSFAGQGFVVPPKPPKPQKVKRERKPINKKTLKIVLFSILGVLLIAGGTILTIFLININKKLDTPTDLVVVDIADKTYAQCDTNEKAKKYVFVVKDSNDRETTFTVETNTLDLTAYFSNVGDYEVKAKYVGDTAKSSSDWTEYVEYTHKHKLATPVVTYDSLSKKLTWVPIENATGYRVYYSGTGFKTIEQPATNANIEFNITTEIFSMGAGQYNLTVMAISNKANFVNSDLSTSTATSYAIQLTAPTNIAFNNETHTLTFNGNADNYKIKVSVLGLNGQQLHEFSYERVAEQTEHNVSLLEYLGGGENVVSISLQAIGDGLTSYSSGTVSWTAE